MIPPKTGKPCCPHCKSHNTVRASRKAIVLTGVGGVLGLLITGLIMLSDKNDDKKGSIGGIILGAFSGASAGFQFGHPHPSEITGRGYFCLDCFRFFTHYPQPIH